MVKLLIIADDFTGALDTGVRYAESGAKIKVVVRRNLDIDNMNTKDLDVLVINIESRHLDSSMAYEIVHNIVTKARQAGIPHIYKKTDSGLRGNVASELTALLDASGEKFLPFIPAFPEMNRITVQGIQYVDGIPLDESVYRQDPFEPVLVSYVPNLFQGYEAKVKVFMKDKKYDSVEDDKMIGVFDAETQDDLKNIVSHLNDKNQLSISAGCAGFATVLKDVINVRKIEKENNKYMLPKRLFVVCGSINEISKEQLEFAQQHGFCRMTMEPIEHLQQGYLESDEGLEWVGRLKQYYMNEKCCILDTATINEKDKVDVVRYNIQSARVQVGQFLGKVVNNLMECNVDNTVIIIGGDTLLHFFETMGCDEVIPVCEIRPGLVLSLMSIKNRKRWVISKSGGFGNKELLVELLELISNERI